MLRKSLTDRQDSIILCLSLSLSHMSLIAAFEAFQEECNIRTANQLVVLCNDAVSAENCGGEAAKGYIATDEMPAAMRQAFLACSRVVLHQSGNVREALKCLAFSRLMSVGHSKSTGTLEQFKFFKVDVFTKILAKADAKGFSVHQTTIRGSASASASTLASTLAKKVMKKLGIRN